MHRPRSVVSSLLGTLCWRGAHQRASTGPHHSGQRVALRCNHIPTGATETGPTSPVSFFWTLLLLRCNGLAETTLTPSAVYARLQPSSKNKWTLVPGIMPRAAWRLSLPCRPTIGPHPGVRTPLCGDCRLALPHAALEPIVIRSILSRPGPCPHRNTSGRWFPAPALELAGVHPLNRVAILADRIRPRNLLSLSRHHGALPARLVEAVDRRFAPGCGGARSLLYSWGSKETGRRGLGFPPDHARPRRGTCFPGRVSVLVEPCFRETVATGRRRVRLGAHHHGHTLRRVERPCRRGPPTSCPHRSPRGYRPVYVEPGFRMGTGAHG
jgi:hypothetical protein